MRVIIIGSSAAGLSCAETLRKGSDAQIAIIGQEKVKPYFRPVLSHMILSDKTEERFFLKPDDFYEKNNIELILDSEVIAIEPKEKNIILKNGHKMNYDKLVLSVGSYNFIPPIKGVEKQGIFDLKYFSDIEKINAYCANKENVVVIGGGLLGIEAAWAFLHAGKKVTILEFMPRLMARQLSEEASRIVKDELERSGIKVLLGKSTKEIIGGEHVEKIMLESGEELPADIVFFSIGVRANVSLAKEADLEVDRGIVVNQNMLTSDSDIYAIGDCAQLGQMVPGIWPIAMQMGKIAASHILGQSLEMKVNPPIAMLKALDIGVYSAGDVSKQDDSLTIHDGEDYKYFSFENGKLTGINLLGNTKLSSKAPKMLAQQVGKLEVEQLLGEM